MSDKFKIFSDSFYMVFLDVIKNIKIALKVLYHTIDCMLRKLLFIFKFLNKILF